MCIFGSMLYSGSLGTNKKLFDYLISFAKFGNFFGKMLQIFLFLWQNLAIFVAKFGISNGNFPRCQLWKEGRLIGYVWCFNEHFLLLSLKVFVHVVIYFYKLHSRGILISSN